MLSDRLIVKWEDVMGTKIKNWFERLFNALVEARQQQVNRMISENGYWRHI